MKTTTQARYFLRDIILGSTAFASVLFLISTIVFNVTLTRLYEFEVQLRIKDGFYESFDLSDAKSSEELAKKAFVNFLNTKLAQDSFAPFLAELISKTLLADKEKIWLQNEIMNFTIKKTTENVSFPLRLAPAFPQNEVTLALSLATQNPIESFAEFHRFAPELLRRAGKLLEESEKRSFEAYNQSRQRFEDDEYSRAARSIESEKQDQLIALGTFNPKNFADNNAFDWQQRWRNQQAKSSLLEQTAATLNSQRGKQRFANLKELHGIFKMPGLELAHQNTVADFNVIRAHSIRSYNLWSHPLLLASGVAAIAFAMALAFSVGLQSLQKKNATRLHQPQDFGRLQQTAKHEEVFHAGFNPDPASSGRQET